MERRVLPFQYAREKSSTGVTALSGLATYLELARAAGLRSSVERHVGLRELGHGWTDSQMVNSLVLLYPRHSGAELAPYSDTGPESRKPSQSRIRPHHTRLVLGGRFGGFPHFESG